MDKLTREAELMIFKMINRGTINSIVRHSNFMNGNSKRSALYNQGVQKGKLIRIVERYGKDFKSWGVGEKDSQISQEGSVCCE